MAPSPGSQRVPALFCSAPLCSALAFPFPRGAVVGCWVSDHLDTRSSPDEALECCSKSKQHLDISLSSSSPSLRPQTPITVRVEPVQ